MARGGIKPPTRGFSVPISRLRVFGIPRLDFAEISRGKRESGRTPALLTGTLPYEIIIIGVYPNGR